MTEWFTSDWHLSHKNAIKLGDRPFSSIEEMDKKIQEYFFSKVSKGDNVFFLGDLTFNKETALNFFKEIEKRKINFYWIYGNHDENLNKKDYIRYCKQIVPSLLIKRNKKKITLTHCPFLTWSGSIYDNYQLYGHIHNNSVEIKELEKILSGKSLNVNVEFHDYVPWSLEEVFDYMEKRPSNWDTLILQRKKKEESQDRLLRL